MPTESVNGVRLWVEVSGAGEPLVLVHGSYIDHHAFDALVPLLADKFRVFTYDRRGHSQSDCPPGQGSLDDDVADLAALIKKLGTDTAHVAGHSLGGLIALRLAAGQPELVRTVVAHEPLPLNLLAGDPAGDAIIGQLDERVRATAALIAGGHRHEAAKEFVELAFGPGHWDLLPPVVKQIFINNAATFLDETNDPTFLRIDLDKLSTCPRPVLLTQGSESPRFFGAALDILAAALPHAQRAAIEGAGHAVQVSHPKEYAELISGFITG